MLAVAGRLPGDDGTWAFEFKWDGIRVLLWIDGGRPRAVSRGGHDITAVISRAGGTGRGGGFGPGRPRRRAGGPRRGRPPILLQTATPDPHRVGQGLPSAPPEPIRRAWSIFDLLHLNGRSLLADSYDDRRAALEQLGVAGPSWGVTPSFTEERGGDVLRSAVELGMEGVVAKRRAQQLPSRNPRRRLDQGKEPTHPGGGHRRMDRGQGRPTFDLRRPPAGLCPPRARGGRSPISARSVPASPAPPGRG